MQISDIVSPTYSVSSNVLKLNNSSAIASTPGCSAHEQELVEFEEYSQASNHYPSRMGPSKRHLTIEIDEMYDCEEQGMGKMGENLNEPSSKVSSNFQLPTGIIKSGENAHSSYHYQQQKMEAMMEQINELTSRCEGLLEQRSGLMKENEALRDKMVKKDELLLSKQHVIEDISKKMAQLESENVQDRFYDEKLREKENKYRELQKVHEKVVAMNRSLQKDLRETEKKILELEKQVQKSAYAAHYENALKVKESSNKLKQSSVKTLNPPKEARQIKQSKQNKENTLANTVKSLQKKKPVTQPKKTARVSSSTINFAKKLTIKTNIL